ncbi:SIS domain-containing protein [Bacteroidota bacterium]
MKFLGIDSKILESSGAIHTAREIEQQPGLWMEIFKNLVAEKDDLMDYLNLVHQDVEKIILTGAGTSAYIGLSLVGTFFRSTGVITNAIPSTDIVTHPLDYFRNDEKLLLISFARSGDSPESLAVVQLADKYSESCYHLIITCDNKGELYNYAPKNQKYCILLPAESNDESLAMTSSYSGMLLAGLLISRLDKIEKYQQQVENLVIYGERIFNQYLDTLKEVAEMNFDRAIFLGSGPLSGTATESHLKLQELTDGKVIAKNDTYLGFRHGPSAVINGSTLIIYLLSNSRQVSPYEMDLMKSIQDLHSGTFKIAIMESTPEYGIVPADLLITFSDNRDINIDEDFLTVCSILPAQIIGFYKSRTFDLSPDSPSQRGAIHRVVQGVKIYNI